MLRASLILGFSMLSSSLFAEESEPLSIMGAEIPGLFERQSDKPYNKLYQILTSGYAKPFSLRMAPLRRAITSFYHGDSDCFLFGTSDLEIYSNAGMNTEQLLVSEAVNQVTMRVYSRDGEPGFNSKEDLEGHFIALDQGTVNVELFSEKYEVDRRKILPTQTLEQAFLLLKQRRVDAVVSFDNDVNLYMQKAGGNTDKVVAGYSLNSSKDAIVCIRSSKTAAFISHVNSRIEQLRNTGELNEIVSAQ